MMKLETKTFAIDTYGKWCVVTEHKVKYRTLKSHFKRYWLIYFEPSIVRTQWTLEFLAICPYLAAKSAKKSRPFISRSYASHNVRQLCIAKLTRAHEYCPDDEWTCDSLLKSTRKTHWTNIFIHIILIKHIIYYIDKSWEDWMEIDGNNNEEKRLLGWRKF